MSRFPATYVETSLRSMSLWLALLAAFSLADPASLARAAITPEGDVSPSGTWTSSTTGYVGNTASGTLTVDNDSDLVSSICHVGYGSAATGLVSVSGIGSTWSNTWTYVGSSGSGAISITNGGSVSSGYGYLGYFPGATGTVTVDGAGSTWKLGTVLTVGNGGSGTLSIANGGSVSVAGPTIVGSTAGSTGLIDFGANGGTLTTQSLFASPIQLAGVGTINAGGLVSDIDLRFDSTLSLKQPIQFQQSGQNVTVNLDVTGGTGTLGAGWKGAGSLTIQNGVKVASAYGYLGYNSGSTGAATISGNGSAWTSGNNLYVGYSGSGTLSIANGGGANSYAGYLGCNSGSTGMVGVDGIGSTWMNTTLSVGESGGGTLSITNGGGVNTTIAGYIGNQSGSTGVVTVDGAGSMWRLGASLYVGNSGGGTCSITNRGSVYVNGATYVGACAGSAGLIDFGANGGTLTTQTLFASTNQLAGTGTINTRGFVGDVNLVFDSTHHINQAIAINQFGQNVVVNLDATSGADALGAGWKGAGSLTIQGGLGVTSTNSYLGYGSDSTGAATVTTNSTWNAGTLYVGYNGSGALSVANRGRVNGVGYLGYNAGSTGVVAVAGTGSNWSSGSLYVGCSGSGVLAVAGGGIVTVSNSSYLGYSPGSMGAATVDGTGSKWTSSGYLYVGYGGSATLGITGGTASTSYAYIGDSFGGLTGPTGKVTVAGTGSTLAYGSILYVGNSEVPLGNNGGSGTLLIANGGRVTGGGISSYIGFSTGSTGVVVVDGTGSKWTNSGDVHVGSNGSGTLSITGGGSVTANSVWVTNSTSVLAVNVGRGSVLTIGTVGLHSTGAIRILAGAGVPANANNYSPIAMSWIGFTPIPQAVGGTWNANSHTFAASSVTAGTTGSPVALNLASVQRALIDDSGPGGSGWEVGASFPSATSTVNITFTATAMSGTALDALRSLLPANESVLSGWTFATTNFSVNPATPVYLSFKVGPGFSWDDLDLWHYSGSTWTKAPAGSDLTYDGTYASFTATSFSDYAMTAVPEPGTLVLLAAGVWGLLACAWQKRKLSR